MKKLNKIIKKHTENKMAKNTKNIAVLEFLNKIIDYLEKNENNERYNIRKRYFQKIRKYVFLEKYFEKEMKEKQIDIVFYLNNFLDKDMFDVEAEENYLEEIEGFYEHLVHPDNSVRNKMMLMSVRIPTINKILEEYKGE